MEIIRAAEMGMCFGVRDALVATAQVVDPSQVTVYGELVHNPRVNGDLRDRGFQQASEDDRQVDVATPQVLVTAHGISNRERQRLEQAGKVLIDTTCPLVKRAHDAAMELQAEGRHVLLIGKQGHVEVNGIIEDLESVDVVGKVADVKHYESDSLGIVCQTTMPSELVAEIRAEVQLRNPLADIRWIDTVCQPR